MELTMSDEIGPNKLERNTKATMLQLIEYTLGLIANNHTKRTIYQELKQEYGVTKNQAYKLYLQALDELKSDHDDNITDIRNKMLTGLRRDLLEAYKLYYMQDDNSNLKEKWFRVYLDIKKDMTTFFPSLTEKEEEDIKVTISYNQIEPSKIT